jgi:transcription elongation factor Elf1
MEQINIRYSGPSTAEYSYTTEFLVECPKCQHQAMVAAGKSHEYGEARLHCSYCSHSESPANLVFYKVSVRDYCDNCSTLISKVIPHAKEPVDGFCIECPSCGADRIYRARNEEYSRRYNEYNAGFDPIFYLPLWLQENVKDNLFWAYNRAHLHDIKQYVGAKLRERQTMKFTTMVEKLPTFIKEAKNRTSILKAIERMERK